MTNRDRENITLSFSKCLDRGSVQETFFPWSLTVNKWRHEGLPAEIADNIHNPGSRIIGKEETYLDCQLTEGIYKYEKYLGFDGLKWMFFRPPFRNFGVMIKEESEQYLVRQDDDGWIRKYYKNSELVELCKPVISCREDWDLLKCRAMEELDNYFTDYYIRKILLPHAPGHDNGEYSIRLCITGFFWTPRDLMGIENHLLAFYDYPELLHDINNFLLNVYMDKLARILDVIPVDVLLISEDLSGVNGPMLSPALFDEFVGSYYKQLIPALKQKGVRHVLVDTDGDFNILIPNFIAAGAEGFTPMDVNAGMDIVAVRDKYPHLKLIGGFNKLVLAKGKEAIDREFERLLPVIRQGGYIPGCDHQVPPSVAFTDYLYYIEKLREAMKEAGRVIP